MYSGSNWDNGTNAGVFNSNLNNTPSNANSNIGARQLGMRDSICCPCHRAKIDNKVVNGASKQVARAENPHTQQHET